MSDLRDDRTLLEVLPPEVASGGPLPLAFALARGKETPVVKMRWDGSEAYRTRVYNCLPAWKPITRCFEDEP
jgi:hypothetical protein